MSIFATVPADPITSVFYSLSPMMLLLGTVVVIAAVMTLLHAIIMARDELLKHLMLATALLLVFPVMVFVSKAMAETIADPDESHPLLTDPPNIDWSTVGEWVLRVVAVAAVISALVWYVLRRRVRKAAARKMQLEREERSELINRKQLRGLQYALDSNLITVGDLRQRETSQLQDRIDGDLAGLLGSVFFEVKEAILVYEAAEKLNWRDKRRLTELYTQLELMYQQPQAVRLKAIALTTDDTIERAGEAIKSVQDAPEG